MKRIKMPLYMRMQNFIELPSGEIFWTSATLTIPQKIKRWWNKDKSEMCNTSRGFTLPWHGQNIRTDGEFIYHDLADDIEVYSLTTGKFIQVITGASSLPYREIAAINTDKAQQGVCYNPKTSKYDFVVFGSRGDRPINIRDIYDGDYIESFLYVDFCEGYWANWEAEGLNYNLKGELEVGISVKTKFFSRHLGAILNYTHKV